MSVHCYAGSHHAVIRVYDAAGNVIETHEHRVTRRAVRFYSHPMALTAKLNFSWTHLLELCKKLSRFDSELIRWKNVSHQSCGVLPQLPLCLAAGLTVCQLRPGPNLRLLLKLVGQE